ncbi:MAG TPA: type II secretion system F family protein [Caulobacteraceae bacterium]|nr:type II secretion system F family protein [Caulobacteraceae bacterium]
MPTDDVLTILLAAGLTLAVLVLLSAMQRADERAAALARLRLVAPDDGKASAAPGPLAFLRHPVGKRREREMREVARALARWRIAQRHARIALTLAEAAGCALLAFAALALTRKLYPSADALWIWLAATIGAGAAGWSAPMLLAHEAADRRAAAIARGLPDALELLVVCTEAGLSLEAGLARVTGALEESQPLLAEELALTAADLRVADLGAGLANLASRVDLPDIHAVVTTLSQSLRYGTPLAESLRGVAGRIRDEAMVRLEERGNRLPTLLTLPMMLLIFPTIFLIVIGPAALNALDAFHH